MVRTDDLREIARMIREYRAEQARREFERALAEMREESKFTEVGASAQA